MKKGLMLLCLACGTVFVSSHAPAKSTTKEGYVSGIVVSVDKYQPTSNYVGDNPSDAPPQADNYTYDIGIRLECNVYVGRYYSAIDFLPSIFAPNHSVDLRLTKHLMFVSDPALDREIKMGIVSHSRLKEQSCPVNG